jgi:excisionase family DNA binding protein
LHILSHAPIIAAMSEQTEPAEDAASDPWVRVEVAAMHLGLSSATVITYARNGLIPGIRLGRSWRFRLGEIDAFLERPIREWEQSPRSIAHWRR